MAASLLARMQGTDLNRQGSASDTRADTQCALSEEVDEFLRSIVLDMDNGSEEPSSPGEIAFKEAGLSATSTMNGAVSSHVPGEAAELVEEGEILDPPVLALYPSHLVSLVRENLTRRGGGSTIAPDVLQQKITELFTDDVCRSLAGLNKEFNAQLNAQIEIKLDEVQNALSSRVKTSDPAENGELAHSPDHPAVCKVASDVSSSDSDADSSSKSGVESKTLRTPEKNYGKGTPMDQGKDEGKDKNNTSRNVTLPDRPKPHIPRLRRNSMNSSSIAPEIDVLYVPRRYSAPFPSSTHNPRSPPSLYRDPDRPAPLSCKDERMLSAHQMSQVAPHDLSGAYSMKRKRDREDYLPYDSPASSSSSSRSRSRSDSPARYVHRLPKRREDLVSYIPGHHRSAYGKHSSDTRSAPSMPGASKPHTRTKRRRMAEGQAGWELRESEKVDGPTHGDTVTSPPMSAATPPPLTASSTTVEPNDDIPRQHPNGLEADTAPPSSIPSQNFSYPLPSLWDVKDGLPSPGILSINFVVDPQTFTQLCIPRAGPNGPDRASQLPFRLQLLCTLDEAWNDLTFDPSSVTPLQMAEEVLKMEVQWPRQGDLIVQVNEGTPWCCTYMPKDLGLSSPPLDLTTSVREGQNTIRLIQLSDMSRHIFVLHASSRDQTPESTPLSADFYKLLMQPQLF